MAGRTLRVAGGSARGVPLSAPRGLRLRPTTGQVREAIFNILGDSLVGARVLDLYAGTGSLGIEALSRGAASALFIERDGAAVGTILENLSRTGLSDRGRVLRGRLPGAAASVDECYSVVLMDPPYGDVSAEETLLAIAARLESEGSIVFEHSSRYNPPERPTGLRRVETRTYGDTGVAFYAHEERT